jgi:hypothetical protein
MVKGVARKSNSRQSWSGYNQKYAKQIKSQITQIPPLSSTDCEPKKPSWRHSPAVTAPCKSMKSWDMKSKLIKKYNDNKEVLVN